MSGYNFDNESESIRRLLARVSLERKETEEKKQDGKNNETSFIGYAYVPKEQLSGIMKMGYLSARLQHELIKESDSILIKKYESQYNAVKDDPEFISWVKDDLNSMPLIERILNYLDWRDESTERGSLSIYFLFSPIPYEIDIRNQIRSKRGDFLKDRILLKFQMKIKSIKDIVMISSDGLSVSDILNKNENWWINRWRLALSSTNHNPLWFDGIPHAYIVSKRGLIEPANISIVDDNLPPLESPMKPAVKLEIKQEPDLSSPSSSSPSPSRTSFTLNVLLYHKGCANPIPFISDKYTKVRESRPSKWAPVEFIETESEEEPDIVIAFDALVKKNPLQFESSLKQLRRKPLLILCKGSIWVNGQDEAAEKMKLDRDYIKVFKRNNPRLSKLLWDICIMHWFIQKIDKKPVYYFNTKDFPSNSAALKEVLTLIYNSVPRSPTPPLSP